MKKILVLISVLTLFGCPRAEYKIGHFNETVVNFGDVNTEYDDYNSTAPTIFYQSLFHFSSNRNSSGNNFDIVGENMYIDWDTYDGILQIGTDLSDDRFDYLTPMFDSINTFCNELGPYSFGLTEGISPEATWADLLLFASDCDGNYDIKFIYAELQNTSRSMTSVIQPVHNIDFLNSDANDLYPTFYGNNLISDNWEYDWGLEASNIEKILFCSDRDGSFNIFEVNVTVDLNLITTLQSDTSLEVTKLEINSKQDDKCPFVNGKLLVFASNRDGGYGGYDLYFSEFKNGNWTEPTNFGESINTEFDEYRPITISYETFDNKLMIFSSNRPGGKGGFDLYHVGINKY